MPYTRNAWTTVTGPVQSGWLGVFAGDPSQPTTVRLATGASYIIPTGMVGTYAWVREASLIAVAYHQVGNDALAYAWNREYDQRLAVWNRAQAGEDLQAILDTMPGDWLTRPVQILQSVVEGTAGAVGDVVNVAIDWAKWLPWLLLGGLAVAGIGLTKGTLRGRYTG